MANQKQQPTAAQRFAERTANVEALIEKLQGAIEDSRNLRTHELDWSDVGSMAHLEELLQEAVCFVTGEEHPDY